jgi:hypothetical protein
MEFLGFLKKYWNMVLVAAAGLATLLGNFATAPDFSQEIPEGQISYYSFSKFLIAILFLIALVPAYLLSKRKYLWLWWGLTVFALGLSIWIQIQYNLFRDRKLLWNETIQRKIVTGDHLVPFADSLYRHAQQTGNPLTYMQLVDGLGGPERVWPDQERNANAQKMILLYLSLVAAYSLCVIFGIQAMYCILKK